MANNINRSHVALPMIILFINIAGLMICTKYATARELVYVDVYVGIPTVEIGAGITGGSLISQLIGLLGFTGSTP